MLKLHEMIKKNFSLAAIIFIMIAAAWYGKNLNSWGKNRVIQNDVISYYAYLPAAFIFNDLSFEFAKSLPEDFDGTIWLQEAPGGKPIVRMTMGLAFLWLPFFLVAHMFAQVLPVSSYGYSWPYGFSIFIAALFYLFIGLCYLRKILLRYYSETITGITLLIVFFATNLIYYVISEPGMAHVYNFALIAAFIHFSLEWIKKPGIQHTIVMGLLAGLIVLIRPVNIIVLVFPALTGIPSVNDFAQRLKSNWKLIILAGFVAFLVLLPQMAFWKMQTGQWLFNSYLDQGKFYFLKPNIWHGLFSFRKGWLIYTPVMFFGLLGIFWLRKKVPGLFLPVLIFVVFNIYIVYSWWCWWYGGSFGSIPMIDMYGVKAIPLAAFFQKANNSKLWLKGMAAFSFLAFIWLNQFQMNQYRSSLLHWDSMTKEAYFSIFGKKKWPENYENLIKIPDYEKALRGVSEYP